MPTQQDAEDLLHQIRRYFSAGITGNKSNNKRYTDDRSGRLPPGAPLHAVVREAKADASAIECIYWRAEREKAGMSDVQFGKMIWTMGIRSGNCWEQACVAAWLAQYSGFTNSWTCAISDPGDHVFALLDYKKPAWKTASDMKTAGGEGWIVDPWANTCCRPNEYVDRFMAKMQKWASAGKRIWYDSKANNFTGWTDALAYKYRNGFLTGPLSYAQCI